MVKSNDKRKYIFNSIKKFAVKELVNTQFSKQAWKMCGNFGLFSMCITKKNGGIAESYIDIFNALKAIGYGVKDSGFTFALNNSMILSSGVLPKYANVSQKELYLAPMLAGDIIGAYAITEPGHGSDAFSMDTSIDIDGDKIILNGQKSYISNAPIADIFVVIAHNICAEKPGYTAVLVEKSDKGVFIGNKIDKMGLESCPMGEISFNNCVLPKERVLSFVGNGFMVANDAMEWERCSSFSSHLGTMERIMEECVRYANMRKQFGVSIGSNQLIRQKIVDMKMAVELGNLLMEDIANKKDKGKRVSLESSLFKYFVGEKYSQVCLDAMQIHGAYGYSKESGIEKEVRDALAAKIYSGTSEIQIEIISQLIGLRG